MNLLPWADKAIARGFAVGPVPLYGSAEWQALAEDDPRWMAAVARAAEASRDHRSLERVEADLREALAQENASIRARMREASWDVSRARDWSRVASEPTREEILARREAARLGVAS